ncbi:MAG: hypothetical protein JST95_12710 [Bacteroidetes bacterium]|nr:hypothetical protein [Bacteroidota bacterium]
MIKFSELKNGDFVYADNDGDRKRGVITDLNGDEKQVCVDTGQAFWYEREQLFPIPVSEEELLGLKFSKQVNEDGSVKYLKGAFRILISRPGDFSKMEVWYRDEKRFVSHEIGVHNLQNHFLEMTKVPLTEAAFD